MLAADAAGQRAWVEKYRVGTDEFALDFDHAFRLAPALLAECWCFSWATGVTRCRTAASSGTNPGGGTPAPAADWRHAR